MYYFYICRYFSLDIPQISGIIQSPVPGITVGDKPSNFLGFICCKVDILLFELEVLPVVLPPLIRRHQGGVRPVRGRPVKDRRVVELSSVDGGFQHEHQPELVLRSLEAGHDEVILEYDQICCGGVLPLGADYTGGYRTLFL